MTGRPRHTDGTGPWVTVGGTSSSKAVALTTSLLSYGTATQIVVTSHPPSNLIFGIS